jgi:hypothetical protein
MATLLVRKVLPHLVEISKLPHPPFRPLLFKLTKSLFLTSQLF